MKALLTLTICLLASDLAAQEQFGDYQFAIPQGWATYPAGSGLWVASPELPNGERCTIGLWPMAPASGDLFADANRAYAQIFNGFMIRPEDPLNKTVLVRGVAPHGWEYVIIRRGIVHPQSPDAQAGGFIMAARIGDRVALISFLSKDPRLSACYQYGYLFQPEVWPRFFASLRFRGWTAASGAGLERSIQGSWQSIGTSTGGGAALQYAFTPSNRYAFFGVGQRYMALSRFEAAVWTSRTFGDGAYVLRGGELTLRPDRGEAEVFLLRLEQVSDDGGEKLDRKAVHDGAGAERDAGRRERARQRGGVRAAVGRRMGRWQMGRMGSDSQRCHSERSEESCWL